MKKLFIYIGICLLFFSYINRVFSFGLDFDGDNFYSKIADTTGELDSKLYTIELNSEGGSTKKINEILGKKCLKSELTEAEIQQISTGNTGILLEKISEECKTNGNISQNLFIQLNTAVNHVDNQAKLDSIKKSDQLQNISKVGVYADGVNENSPFDIMGDIELIDEIIFEKTEEYDFEGDGNVDLSEKIKDQIDKKVTEIKNESFLDLKNTDLVLCKLNGKCDNKEDLDRFLCEKLGDCTKNPGRGFIEIGNTNQCKVNDSGLSSGDNIVTGNIIDDLLGHNGGKNNNGDTQSSGDDKIIEPISDYKKVNDNKSFPCNDFFCIDVSFDSYNHNLLGGWANKFPSIEFLINRSNKHLKKFANSSLVQSKMTLNNFELGLKDIDLSQMFHMSFNISSKPVPILDLNKDFSSKTDNEGGEDEPIYTYKNQLREYYKAYNLDYDRQNDLSLFSKIKSERLSSINSGYLKTSRMAHLLDNYYSEKAIKSEKIKEIEKSIEEKTRNSIISDFEFQFKELEGFSRSLNEYVLNLDSILDNMLKIPVDEGVN